MMLQAPEFEVLVRKVRSETSEIRSFELVAKPGEVLPAFEAGAHIDVFPLPGLCRQADPVCWLRQALPLVAMLLGEP